MTANDIFKDARVMHVRELKDKLAKVTAELSATRAELESLKEHTELAILAAKDIDAIPEGGTMIIVDGWNAALNSVNGVNWREKRAKLINFSKWLTKTYQEYFVWIVFDGATAGGESKQNIRISYTGGNGEHRADKMICDFLRMLKIHNSNMPVAVVTNDKDFSANAKRLGAKIISTNSFTSGEPSQWNLE